MGKVSRWWYGLVHIGKTFAACLDFSDMPPFIVLLRGRFWEEALGGSATSLLGLEDLAFALQTEGGGEVLGEFLLVGPVQFSRVASGEAIEVRVDGEIPFPVADGVTEGQRVIHLEDPGSGADHGCCRAVLEGSHADHVLLVLGCVSLREFAALSGDGDVTSEPGVDVIHDLAERDPVRGRVLDVVVCDVIVNHLMDDGILQGAFVHFIPGVDAERVVISVDMSEAVFACFVAKLSEIVFGVTEFDARQGQFAVEAEAVVFGEDA